MPRYSLVITLDYEVSTSGDFDVRREMIRPTWELLEVCEDHGAKLTIMAEIAEMWAYETAILSGLRERLGYDPSLEIRKQLIEVIKRSHDVQLRLHPQWFNAKWSGNEWKLDYSRCRLPLFDYHGMVEVLRRGKQYLGRLLRP